MVVHFKDDASLSGVLVELSGQRITVELGGAQASWPMDLVERIERRRTDVEAFKELEREARSDPAKIRRLAQFARAKGLHTCYNRLVEEWGLAVEPKAFLSFFEASLPEERQAQSVLHRPERPAPGIPEIRIVESPPQAATIFIPVAFAAPRVLTKEDQEVFIKELEARREVFRRRVKSPMEEWQFRFQEALDRRAHGLPFASEPF